MKTVLTRLKNFVYTSVSCFAISRYGLVFVFVFLIAVLSASAQGPSMSYGEQFLAVNDQECMRRVPLAFRAEGYEAGTPSVNTTYGRKGIHSAYIRCLGEPEKGRTRVIIVVASSASDENVPGAERVKLQRRMEQTTSEPASIPANWSTSATGYRGQNIRVTFNCPAGGSANNVWGTDYYTDDSSVCTAAVHMGLIQFAYGGRVTIEMRQGSQSYSASTRYGVTTRSYASWYGSFVFVR